MQDDQKQSTALVETTEKSLVATQEKPGYWARVSRRYLWAFRVILILIKIFAVLFVSLTATSFSGNGIYYFAKDLSSIAALAEQDRSMLYYNYGRSAATHAAFRGGTATVHDRGVEILTAAGEPTLIFERAFASPAICASRNYVLAYDLGGTAFSLCNAYDELYRGVTTSPIVYATVTDNGVFAVVTSAVTENGVYNPSEVLWYGGNFKLTQRFKRASATTSVSLSADGRYIAILGVSGEGTLLDIYARKSTEPQASLTFEGFPCAVGFTSSDTVAVLTDAACHTLRTNGKLYKSVSFNGQALLCYDIDEKAVAIALQTDAVRSQVRLVACDKKGNVKYEETKHAEICGLSLVDRTVWILTPTEATAVDMRRSGAVTGRAATAAGALGIEGTSREKARVFYPAYAIEIDVWH